MLSRTINEQRQTPLELPKQTKIESIKIKISESKSSESLSEMCSFDPTTISSTPPEGYFIHNLRARMDKF